MNLFMKISTIILGLLLICVAASAAETAWSVDITSSNQLEPVTFGYNSEATDDEFNPSFDEFTTNPIQGKIIFSLDYIYAKKFKKDDLSWTLSVTIPLDNSEILWNSSDLPQNIKLSMTKDTTVIDMKEQSSLVLNEGSYEYTITADVQESPVLTTVEVTPETASVVDGGTRQFTAKGYDQYKTEMSGLTFT